MKLRFTGFKQMCEQDFKKSNMDGVLARDLNITPEENNKTADVTSPGGAIQFKGNKLKALNKLIGLEGDDVALKLIQVVNRNKFGVQIKDITGACNQQGLNIGRDSGPYANRPFPNAPCSPTHDKTWWISAKDWDSIRMPLPSGGGQAGGGMGGGLGGGMGGGGPSPTPPPSLSAAPAGPAGAGGGSPPPPPA